MKKREILQAGSAIVLRGIFRNVAVASTIMIGFITLADLFESSESFAKNHEVSSISIVDAQNLKKENVKRDFLALALMAGCAFGFTKETKPEKNVREILMADNSPHPS